MYSATCVMSNAIPAMPTNFGVRTVKRLLSIPAAATRAIHRLMADVRLAASHALMAMGGMSSPFCPVVQAPISDLFNGQSTRTNSIRNEEAGKYQWYGNTGFIRAGMLRFAGGLKD